MIIQLPPREHLSAAELHGTTRLFTGGPAVQRAAVVLKAAFTLHPDGTGTMQPEADSSGAHHLVAYADAGAEIDGIFAVDYEADIALNKARSDVVVAGWLAPPGSPAGMEADVLIDGATWFTRRASAPGEVPAQDDGASNLLGWLGRSLLPRAVASPAVDPTSSVLPVDYDPSFNNFHHRSGEVPGHPAYGTPGGRNEAPVPSGALVSCRQWRNGAASDTVQYDFRLPETPAYTAQLRAYCGHGPDKARHWKVAGRVALSCDTLIAYPSEDRMVLLWRASWDPELEPAEHWRMIQILEGSS